MWEALVAPRRTMDLESQRSSRLLASLLVVLIPLGLVSGLIQLLLVPGFRPTFLAMCAALTVLSGVYGIARLGHYQLGTTLTAAAISSACLSAVALNPKEELSPAFLLLATLLVGSLLPFDKALLFTCANVVLLAVIVGDRVGEAPVILASSVLFVIGSSLLLTLARHRQILERERQAMLSEASAQVRLGDRLSSIGILTAEIAHEMSSPLTCAAGSLELIRPFLSDEKAHSHLKLAQDGVARATAFLREMRRMARHDQGSPQLLDVPSTVMSSLNLTRGYVAKRAQLICQSREVPPVYGDATKLSQVVVNLVMNAAQAIEPNNPGEHSIRVSVGVSSKWVTLDVQDTGSGIAPEKVERIFEPFFSTKGAGDGAGLGLAIVQRIVHEMGGFIEVESTLGHGARFGVRLPAAEPAAIAAAHVTMAISDAQAPARGLAQRQRS